MNKNAEVIEKYIKSKKTFLVIIFGAITLGIAVSFIFAIPSVKSFLRDYEKDS
jgi:hypothetical protein